MNCRNLISTHTPAWGVTLSSTSTNPVQNISTHTPAWGVTWRHVVHVIQHPISTHTPAWGVTQIKRQPSGAPNISTHTPAWGVTVSRLVYQVGIMNFNSHARVGRDAQKIRRLDGILAFQLTRPRGA